MRSNNPIKVTMKIPFPISKPDRNGIIYTKEAETEDDCPYFLPDEDM